MFECVDIMIINRTLDYFITSYLYMRIQTHSIAPYKLLTDLSPVAPSSASPVQQSATSNPTSTSPSPISSLIVRTAVSDTGVDFVLGGRGALEVGNNPFSKAGLIRSAYWETIVDSSVEGVEAFSV